LATKKDVKDALQKWIQLIEKNPDISTQFVGYKKTFLLTFTDLKYSVQMVFDGSGKAKLVDGAVTNPEMSLTVDSGLFLKISNGELDPMEAFMSGQLKPKGNMADLQKMEVFMDLFEQ
jgi:putative sterol carrier protein